MNLGKAFSIPQKHGFIQNGDIWISTPPENPVLQITNHAQSEMPQNQIVGSEDWQDLLGIYTGLLQNQPSNATPQNFNQNNLVGPKNSNPIGLNHGLQHSQAVDPVMAYNGQFRNFDPTGPTRSNPREYSTPNHQKEGITGSFVPPRKVDTLAELMGMKSVTSNGAPYRSTNIVDKPIIICPHSQGESNTRNHVVHANRDIGVNNLQETPNGRLSAPYRPNYNLNLPPGSEAGESSSTSRPFPLGPVTPDQQKQSNTHQIIQVPHLLIDEMYTPEKYKQGNIISTPKHPEILEKDHNELLKNNSEGGNGGIDLNKTPQQKTPKRKKHRPKVVIEGKPKKTPKPAVEKSNTPSGIPTPKRKYTRKNGVKTSTNTSTDPENAVEVSTMERPTKSCKRALNFDLDNGAKTESLGREFDNSEGNKRHFNLNLNLDSQIAEWSMELNGPSTSVVRDGQQNTYGKEKQQTEIAYNFVHSVNKSPQESLQLAATNPPPTYKDRALNIIARSLYTRNASINNSGDLAVILANTSEPTIDNRRQSTLQIMPHVTEKQGREHVQAEPRECQTIDLMGSRLWSRGISETSHSSSVSNKIWQNGFINGKKTKGEDKFHGTSFSIPSGTTNVDISGQTESRGNRSFPAQSSIMHQNGGLTNSHTRGQSNSRNSNNKSTVSCDRYMNSQDLTDKFQQQHTSSQAHLRAEKMPQKTYHHLAKEQIINSLTTVTNWNPESASKRGPKFVPTNEILNSPNRVAVKKRTAGQASSKKVSIMDKNLQQDAENWRSHGHSTKKVTGSQDKINLVCVDYLTDRMKDLHIHGNGKEIVWKEQNALVPFKGDGAIVSYEEFNPVKKRRPRPRVDLDPETNRLWNLLMGKEGSESAETMDNDKQKWWEEERKVFRGRVDSFIARMHLVQGDRRFSKWKGSVVDSVIGVFLTQNVSDHLSSSAFMSLAAKFPLKARTMSPSVEHHEVRITFPDETTIYDHKLTRETEFNNSSGISKEASKHEEGDEIRMRTFLRNDSMKRAEEDVISSQNSSESIIIQASEDIKSSSGSNSEIEDEWNISKNQTYQTISNQSSVLPSTNSYPNMSIGLEEWEARVLSLSGEESISSFSSAVDLLTSSIGVGHPHDTIGQSAEISFIETPKSQPNKHVELQTNLPDGSHNRNGQHLIKHRQGEIQETFQQESAFPADPTRPAEVFGKQPSGNVQRYPNEDIIADNITHKPTEMGKTQSSGKPSTNKTSTTTPNERKRKAEKEKAEPFNWDTLRKQVESMAGTRERSRAAMDSLDYEALRNADVREISDTIKERGMNNMLAERIKDFLNRLVRDHEKVDLEWLRDVQPDKSKDYLLSIRGLGLKSVECVRLLTLHHLAFPVDTNVGRIAVRLGWVPLQPLPESLQLHLLEMYPVLDSIQKYLWPRLCKLDQETLYELHYQMITFGKVFCTKRDPNCNACPMRAECRHFASAFASARLALPGPDERRIVTSATPTSANKSSNVTIKPIGLLPSEDNLERGMGLKGNCEPLIEEPKTPEPPIKVSERDIEDAFYEDPDEIPVIKLNVEEFTSNLQSFMQEQMEIGEDDMSKALVALSPEFASIPTPKLKHVSRLRTEHQVYELPDSHPLLKDMDRREPDDPSPYLLAIWTPGETADSVQPPEPTCGSQEGGGLCNKTTCFACNSAREAQAQTVRGTILMPCRTAMRGSFPLNGTYFQVNEVFADHESSLNPIDVPRSLLWNLPRRTVFFGTSVTSIFKGLSTEDIQFCFWKGFVCVRGFDQKTRAPRPLKARLHLPASKMVKKNE